MHENTAEWNKVVKQTVSQKEGGRWASRGRTPSTTVVNVNQIGDAGTGRQKLLDGDECLHRNGREPRGKRVQEHA